MKFIENYHKHNKLKLLFKETNNLKIVKRKKKGINYLGIHNIVDKTYFLENTPNNKYIIGQTLRKDMQIHLLVQKRRKCLFLKRESNI